jgi:hypothetical protein
LEGGGYDARADVFSLGVVVWEALSASLSNPLTSLDATRLRERLADPGTHLPLPTVSLTYALSQSHSTNRAARAPARYHDNECL